MGRIIREFLGDGEARFVQPTRKPEFTAEDETVLASLLDRVDALKADRALNNTHELSVLQNARDHDKQEIKAFHHDMRNRQNGQE